MLGSPQFALSGLDHHYALCHCTVYVYLSYVCTLSTESVAIKRTRGVEICTRWRRFERSVVIPLKDIVAVTISEVREFRRRRAGSLALAAAPGALWVLAKTAVQSHGRSHVLTTLFAPCTHLQVSDRRLLLTFQAGRSDKVHQAYRVRGGCSDLQLMPSWAAHRRSLGV